MALAAAAAASKGAPLAGLLKNLLLAAPAPSSSSALRPASFAATRRLFSTGGTPFAFSIKDAIEELTVFYSRIQGRLPNISITAWRWWVSKKDENALQVKMELPGLPAENVSVSADPKAGLFVKGVGVRDDAQDRTTYAGLIGVSSAVFELHQAQTEVKDGVLTVTVPRVKVDLSEWTEIKVRKG